MNGTAALGPFSSLSPETTVGLPVSLAVLVTIAVTVAVLVFPRASGPSYVTEIRERLSIRLTRRRTTSEAERVERHRDPESRRLSPSPVDE